MMKKVTYTHLIRNSALTVMGLAAASLMHIPTQAHAFEMSFSTLADNMSGTVSSTMAGTLAYSQSAGGFHPAVASDSDKASFHKVSAAAGGGAEKFIGDMAGRALAFLGNEGLSQEQKISSFRSLLNDSFDLETIGRFTLGRYWKTSTEAQRQEYLTLFRRMVVDVYAKRFGDYKGQRFETRGARADGDKDTIVTSYIIPGSGPEVQVDWRVRYKNGKYKIVDVIVEGVSMSVTQRSDFAAVIQRGGGDVSVLLAYLRGA